MASKSYYLINNYNVNSKESAIGFPNTAHCAKGKNISKTFIRINLKKLQKKRNYLMVLILLLS